jgi:hypothetical protein
MKRAAVISMTITAAVIGLCTTPEKYAPIASRTTAWRFNSGSHPAASWPRPAPTDRLGVNRPPGMALISDTKLASALLSAK